MTIVARTIGQGSHKASIPAIGYGTWKVERSVCADLVYNALKTGVRHIDSAAIYGNEKETGEGLKKAFADNICGRKDLFITSKLWNDCHGSAEVKAACKKTITDLGLSYLDLYLVHFPKCSGKPVPLMETWGAMEELVADGSCKNIGVSNFSCQLLADLLTYAKIPPAVNQVEMHPYLIQKNLRTYCAKMNIAVTAYSPFGGLSYVPLNMVDEGELLVLKHPTIQSIADRHKATPAQVILRWFTQMDCNINVVAKSSSNQRIKENLDSQNLSLTDDDIRAISSLDKNRRYNISQWDDGTFTFDY